MLFNDLLDARTGFTYPDGYRHDLSREFFNQKLRKASYFVLDEQATAMAASVAFSKPSSIIACLPFLKQLPADPMWIEFSNQQLRNATSQLGSSNIPKDSKNVAMERCGFLISMKDGKIVMEFAYRQHTNNVTVTDMAPLQGVFDVATPSEHYAFPALFSSLLLPKDFSEDSVGKLSGKVAQSYRAIDRDPDEAAADREIELRMSWKRHPEMDRLRKAQLTLAKPEQIDALDAGQAGDMVRFFVLQVLPTLILLNCRNAVDREIVEAPVKLNKSRIAKGKSPIPEYQLVKMHLSPSKRKVYQASGTSAGNRKGGLVIGHFKVRKNGIWWWSPHWRGSTTEATPTRVSVLTR